MHSSLLLDTNKLHIFHELRKRKIFVGELIYDKEKNIYELIYDKNYVHAKNAIPLGVGLDLFHLRHQSKKGQLFDSLIDRIPLKANPAYKDYCESQGISPDEKNPMVLLGTIGRRGPSTFVFEPVYFDPFTYEDIKNLRTTLQLTQNDFAAAFDISKPTLQRIEAGKSHDLNTLKRVQILFRFPEAALWQLKQTGKNIHRKALEKLVRYFESNITTTQ